MCPCGDASCKGCEMSMADERVNKDDTMPGEETPTPEEGQPSPVEMSAFTKAVAIAHKSLNNLDNVLHKNLGMSV